MSNLVLPPGMVKGCLPRKDRVGDFCEVASKAIDIRPREQWKDFIGKVDYRQYQRFTFYQGEIGSCATEAVSMGIMLKRVQMGIPFVKLNPWSMYYTTSGGRDRGSIIGDNLKYAREYGIVPDAIWPRYALDDRRIIHPWHEKPSEQAYAERGKFKIDEYCDCSSILDVGSCLCDGIIVVFGWEGHSCILVALKDENTAYYLNSWGADWGRNGIGEIGLHEINFSYGAFGILSVTYS